MGWVTHLGDFKVGLFLATLGIMERAVVWTRLSKREKGAPPLLPWLGVLVAGEATGWLKRVVGRPRPAELISGLGLTVSDAGRSFPSGHATIAFALAGALSLRWPRARLWWLSLAGLVALSRVALGAHWPSDVVVGAAIGLSFVAGFNGLEHKVVSLK